MQKRTKLAQQFVVASCATAVLVSAGCRSAMPKWNLFGSRRAPSAEMLAGDGPTTTYPTPPGESMNPVAIASTAGGTAGTPPMANIASNTGAATNSGFNTNAINTNAAQANGFGAPGGVNLASSRSNGGTASSIPAYAASTRSPATGTSPTDTSGIGLPGKNSSVPTIPAGYQFGKRGTTPSIGMPSTGPSGTPDASSSNQYNIPSAYPAPGAASSYSAPNANTTGSVPTSNESAPSSTGFTLPGMPTAKTSPAPMQSAPFQPKTATTSIGMPLPGATPNVSTHSGNASTPKATPARTASATSQPAFSTASAEITPRTKPSAADTQSSSYAPGSTGTAAGYPATSGYPTTGTDGSFYR